MVIADAVQCVCFFPLTQILPAGSTTWIVLNELKKKESASTTVAINIGLQIDEYFSITEGRVCHLPLSSSMVVVDGLSQP